MDVEIVAQGVPKKVASFGTLIFRHQLVWTNTKSKRSLATAIKNARMLKEMTTIQGVRENVSSRPL